MPMGAGGAGRFDSARSRGAMQKTESASFDLGDDDDFESEAATGEVAEERSRSVPLAEAFEDKKVAPPRALAQEALPPAPAKAMFAGIAPPAENQPAQPGAAVPHGMTPPPAKPVMPARPEPRAKTRKNQLAIAIAILIAAILALLWWLIG